MTPPSPTRTSEIAQAFLEVSGATEKVASESTVEENELSDEDRRKRRLAELLRKRQHTGTATGSASPNPPR